jgi:hypothetical protein
VQPFPRRRLDERMIAESFEVLFELQRAPRPARGPK